LVVSLCKPNVEKEESGGKETAGGTSFCERCWLGNSVLEEG
jgi:hypothetical protein